MTLEEAQKLIAKGNKEGNFQLVEEGLAAIKLAQQQEVSGAPAATKARDNNFIAPIERTASVGPGSKNYGKKEPINLRQATAFNMFTDNGSEHRNDKLRPEDKGAWGTTEKARAEARYVSVVCGHCGNEYEVAPLFAKKIEINPDGSMFNGNVCNECLSKRKRSVR